MVASNPHHHRKARRQIPRSRSPHRNRALRARSNALEDSAFSRVRELPAPISAINGNTLTIKSFDGTTATVNVTPDTTSRKDQQQAKLSDFKVGDMVMVRGTPAGMNVWTASMMPGTRTEANQRFREGMGKQFIMGEIKSVDGAEYNDRSR